MMNYRIMMSHESWWAIEYTQKQKNVKSLNYSMFANNV